MGVDVRHCGRFARQVVQQRDEHDMFQDVGMIAGVEGVSVAQQVQVSPIVSVAAGPDGNQGPLHSAGLGERQQHRQKGEGPL